MLSALIQAPGEVLWKEALVGGKVSVLKPVGSLASQAEFYRSGSDTERAVDMPSRKRQPRV